MTDKVAPSASVSAASAQPTGMHRQRLSFASVAAMAPPSKQTAQGLSSSTQADNPVLNSTRPPIPKPGGTVGSSNISPEVNESFARLDIKDGQYTVPDVSEHDLQAPPLQVRPVLDDEKTHHSFSSNKASSLDGKSVASATTFAMDEKESIRPDDSASVKAADDDDSNSGHASGAPSSRVGSEAGERAFGNQFNEISERMTPGMLRSVQGVRRVVPGITGEPRGGFGVQSVPPGTGMPQPDQGMVASTAPFTLPTAPDEKILEAMETPKDRIFLLGLEQQVISFIRDTTDPVLSLPPCNSFCRLLAHRLGDYYALDHVLDNSQSAVLLHRTPHCQLRPPLTSFEKPPPSIGSGSILPSMKIMRRTDMPGDVRTEGSGTTTTDNSVGPSKAASEADSENQKASGLVSPAESATTKDKTATREEREAKYKEARDRIFADWKEGDTSDAAQLEGDASRASSTSGKKKNKKKNNDDSFDSRSTYSPYYTSSQRQGPVYEQAHPSNVYNLYMAQGGGQMFPNGFQPTYGQQYSHVPTMQGFPMQIQSSQPQPSVQMVPTMYPGPAGQQQQQYMQYGLPMPTNFYPPGPQPNQMVPPHPQSMPSPVSSSHSAPLSRPQSQMSDQGWGQPPYQNHYQGFASPQHQYPNQTPQQMAPQMNNSTVPYAYGQLPYQPNGPSSRPIHPIPGSYNRQNHYGHSPNRPQPMDPHAFRSSSGPQGGAMLNTHVPQQTQFSTGQQFHQSFSSQNSSPRKISGSVPRSQSPGQSTLSKWGTPPTLPPKPPPVASNTSIPTASAGGVPTFQNGTYSKPVNSTAENKVSSEPVASQ